MAMLYHQRWSMLPEVLLRMFQILAKTDWAPVFGFLQPIAHPLLVKSHQGHFLSLY